MAELLSVNLYLRNLACK